MKYNCCFLLFISTIRLCLAQSDTVYFNFDWEKCSSSDARYYRLITKKDGKRIVTDYYSNGIPQMIAEVSGMEPLIKDGKCTYFGRQGNKLAEGSYKNNYYDGIWTWWINKGTDSTIVEYDESGIKNRIRPEIPMEKGKVLNVVEVMPEFPGGQEKMFAYIKENLVYPQEARKDNIEGQVTVSFVIDRFGSTYNVKIKQGVRDDIDQAAMKVIKDMPEWSPGTQNGLPVDVQYNVPLKFSLTKKKEKVKGMTLFGKRAVFLFPESGKFNKSIHPCCFILVQAGVAMKYRRD